MSELAFHVVRCPRCGAVVMEIATGLARGKCPGCKRRVWAMADGKRLRLGIVDAPRARLPAESATAAGVAG
jgi:Zn finger protein HypA/HybF involved in hydrogenase expression